MPRELAPAPNNIPLRKQIVHNNFSVTEIIICMHGDHLHNIIMNAIFCSNMTSTMA